MKMPRMLEYKTRTKLLSPLFMAALFTVFKPTSNNSVETITAVTLIPHILILRPISVSACSVGDAAANIVVKEAEDN